ncbi:MAG: response regulator transcription factor [Clostridiales bacterium]|nr:response regulator transcription factor [Clostridiales bacterium]
MSPAKKVVIVEDDESIAELIDYNLSGEGYSVSRFKSGQELMDHVHLLGDTSLFVLDIMLPGMDGYEICSWLRAQSEFAVTPVMMLTARASEADKVRGLNEGADDYVTKPFGIREFLARVAAQIRRFEATQTGSGTTGVVHVSPNGNETVSEQAKDMDLGRGDDSTERDVLRSGSVVLDDVRHRVFLNEKEIEMTNREYELLKFLMSHRGVAFSRDALLNSVWGYEYVGETRTVDVHIRQIRKKLEKDDAHPEYIETVRGRGYRFKE